MIVWVKVALIAAVVAALVGMTAALVALTAAQQPRQADSVAACLRITSSAVTEARTQLDSARTKLEIATNQGSNLPALALTALDADASLRLADQTYQADVTRSLVDPSGFIKDCRKGSS